MCGVTDDDGALMVECDDCGVWQHNACVGLTADDVPSHFACTFCAAKPGAALSATPGFRKSSGELELPGTIKFGQ